MKKCLIISGAPEKSVNYYKEYASKRFIITADSGYYKCMEAGLKPDLIIGDFDSSPIPHTDIQIIVLPIHKDDTDTMFAVKTAIEKGFSDIVILGGIGSRLDHTYSNILALNYCSDRNIACVLADKSNKAQIVKKHIEIYKSDGYKSFSLFSVLGDCEGLTTRGSEYDLHDFTLTADNMLAQSNCFLNDTVSIDLKKGKLLLIQSND